MQVKVHWDYPYQTANGMETVCHAETPLDNATVELLRDLDYQATDLDDTSRWSDGDDAALEHEISLGDELQPL